MMETTEGITVPILTLEYVVKKHKLKGAILKIDCEGHEYEIFDSTSNKILQCFDEIIIETHYGTKPIVKKLESAGFETKNLGKLRIEWNIHTNKTMHVQMVYAKR